MYGRDGRSAGLTHGGTLSFPSCQVGSPGTIGGPASNNISLGSPGSQAPAPAQGSGYVLLCTSTGCGTPPTLPAGGGDVQIESVGTDVRCVPGGATTCSPPGSNGAQTTTDYLGALRGTSIIRITDHNNGAPGYTTSGTVSDLPFTVDGACAANPGTGAAGAPIGATCTVPHDLQHGRAGRGRPRQAGHRPGRRGRRNAWLRRNHRHRRWARRQRGEHHGRPEQELRESGNPHPLDVAKPVTLD